MLQPYKVIKRTGKLTQGWEKNPQKTTSEKSA